MLLCFRERSRVLNFLTYLLVWVACAQQNGCRKHARSSNSGLTVNESLRSPASDPETYALLNLVKAPLGHGTCFGTGSGAVWGMQRRCNEHET